MAKNIPDILRWNHGDPPIWLDLILSEIEGPQRQQVMNHYLDAVTANLHTQLKLVENVRQTLGAKRAGA
jgi:hypothetical protein